MRTRTGILRTRWNVTADLERSRPTALACLWLAAFAAGLVSAIPVPAHAGRVVDVAAGTRLHRRARPWNPAKSVPGNIVKIAAGWYHTCAINLFSEVRCWGWNNHGQLGSGGLVNYGGTTFDGTTTPTSSFVQLGSGRRAIDITASAYSTCVLLDNQQVKCWGYNEQGQLGLGLGSADRGGHPGDIGDALPALNLLGAPATMKPVRLLGGRLHHCAVFDDQLRAKGWGYNGMGQLGIGTTQLHGRNPNEMGAGLPFITSHPLLNVEMSTSGRRAITPVSSAGITTRGSRTSPRFSAERTTTSVSSAPAISHAAATLPGTILCTCRSRERRRPGRRIRWCASRWARITHAPCWRTTW